MIFGRSKGLVGLDIGSSSVKLVELKPLKGDQKWKLVNIAMVPLSPEVIVDGSVMDSTMVVDAITQLFTENKIKSNDVAIAVSGHSVIIKKITMAYMAAEELAESIRWEAESYIPFDIDDVNLDYQVIDEEDRGDGNMDVLLVAAKKEKVSEYVSVVQQAGKNPVVVDVDSFALQNSLTANYELSDLQITALINIGASVMNINIIQGGTSIFWRDISFGGNLYTDAIQKDLGVDFDTAEQLKQGESVEGFQFDRVIPIIKSVTNDLGVEVQKTFDFFKATTSAEKINRIMLSGGCSRILNLDDYLSERFDAPVEMLNPFQSITYNEKQFSSEDIHEIKASAAIASGLAMRSGGNKQLIHINLIAGKKAGTAPKTAKKSTGQQSELQENAILIMSVLLAFALVFTMRHFVKKELRKQQTEEATLKAEWEQLKHWEEKKETYEIQKELLNEKIKTISDLQDQRQGPVQLMEDIYNVLPESIWLKEIRQGYDRGLLAPTKSGRKVYQLPGRNLGTPREFVVTGFASSAEAITNFANKVLSMNQRYNDTVLNDIFQTGGGPQEYTFNLYFQTKKKKSAEVPPDGKAGGG